MNQYMITILLLVCVVFASIEHRTHPKFRVSVYFISAFLFSLLFAFRNPITTRDTAVYVEIFQRSAFDGNWFSRIDRYEGGYCFLNRIVHLFTDNPVVLFFLISIVGYCILFCVLDITKEKSTSCFYPISFICLYTSYFGQLYNGIVMRACLAISFVYLSCAYFSQKKIFTGILTYILACSFHQSAILAFLLPIIFYKGISISKNKAYILTALLLIAYLMGVSSYTSQFLSSSINLLTSQFPSIQLFRWGQLMIEERGFDIEASVALSRIFYFFLLFFIIKNETHRECGGYVISSIVALFILTFFGNFSLTVRVADYYLIAIIFAFIRLLSQKRVNLNLISSPKIIINSTIILVLVSVFFSYLFLSNVVS